MQDLFGKKTKIAFVVDKEFKGTMKKMDKLDEYILSFGYIDEKKYPDDGGMYTTTLGYFFEFGTEELPEKSILRKLYLQYSAEIELWYAEATSQVLFGTKDPLSVLAVVGEKILVVLLKIYDDSGIYDTGLLRSSLGWQVSKGSRVLKKATAGGK